VRRRGSVPERLQSPNRNLLPVTNQQTFKNDIFHVCYCLPLATTVVGCIEWMRCRLLLRIIVVSVRRSVSQSVCLSVMRPNLAVRAVCAGSFGAACVKSLWFLVFSPYRVYILLFSAAIHFTVKRYRNVLIYWLTWLSTNSPGMCRLLLLFVDFSTICQIVVSVLLHRYAYVHVWTKMAKGQGHNIQKNLWPKPL